MAMTKTKRQLRAEAVERLKNCMAARFDAESIVIALTSGRHGQSDWSLECDKLIYLLTDDANDDSAPESGVSDSKVNVTTESCRQYADQREQGDDADCESCDSREKLEADVLALVDNLRAYGFKYAGDAEVEIIDMLDRQAAITRAEWCSEQGWWDSAEECNRVTAKVYDLQAKVAELRAELEKATNNLNSANEDFENARAELTAERDRLKSRICNLDNDLIRTRDERDNWKANCEDWKKDCERYRSKFGKALDLAHEIRGLGD